MKNQASVAQAARVSIVEVDHALFYFDGDLYEFERIAYEDEEAP